MTTETAKTQRERAYTQAKRRLARLAARLEEKRQLLVELEGAVPEGWVVDCSHLFIDIVITGGINERADAAPVLSVLVGIGFRRDRIFSEGKARETAMGDDGSGMIAYSFRRVKENGLSDLVDVRAIVGTEAACRFVKTGRKIETVDVYELRCDGVE